MLDTIKRVSNGDLLILLPGICTTLPSTDLEGSIRIAEDIRQVIHDADIDHEGFLVAKLTISMGVTSLIPVRGTTQESIVEHTDQALYRAKNQGRDRIES